MQRLLSVASPPPRCEVCCDLDALRLGEMRARWTQNTSPAEFEMSSQRGCPGCKIVIAILQYYIPNLDRHQCITLSSKQSARDHLRLVLHNEFPTYAFDANEHCLEISSFSGQNCPWSAIKAADPISGDTGSDEAITCARAWLDRCIGHHGMCSRIVSIARPARLLQISGPINVRLCVLDVKEDSFPYICLSHCWGLSSFIKTTLSTINQYRSRINWDELPRTFQDAIFFAYRLGYMYIWIDSLCIIQDSIDDWRREGGKMASIYQGATLTLFATHSLDSSGGCYVVSRSEYQSCIWDIEGLGLEEGPYSIHSRLSLCHKQLLVDDLPLLRRGWALQERLLSPRNLYFTENELVWECTETWMCECTHIDNAVTSWSMKKAELHPSYILHEPLEMVDFQWRRVVESYSKMSLTYAKDIFPGLQGLAKLFQSRMGTYLAGLWKETLVYNLSWYSAHVPTRSCGIWRAPSWSWASITGEISWFSIGFPDTAETGERATFIGILDATTTPKGHDATGEIISGELVIRGRGLKGTLVPLGTRSASGSYADYDLMISAIDGQPLSIRPFFLDRKLDTCSPESVHYVDIGSRILVVKVEGGSYRAGPQSLHHTAWLVLVCRDSNQHIFERIGLFVSHETDQPKGSWGDSTHLTQAWEEAPEIEMKII